MAYYTILNEKWYNIQNHDRNNLSETYKKRLRISKAFYCKMCQKYYLPSSFGASSSTLAGFFLNFSYLLLNLSIRPAVSKNFAFPV